MLVLPQISKLAYGSMRMLENGRSHAEWSAFLNETVELGVRIWHSSNEYQSFPMFAEIARAFSQSGVQLHHIVKLAEPSFREQAFNADRLIRRLDAYLGALGIDQIWAIQWMWRGDLSDDGARLAGAIACEQEMSCTFEQLRKQGKICKVLTFPYSTSFAAWSVERSWCDGLACYLNPLETEMVDVIARANESNKFTAALRPLAAGRAIRASINGADSLRWVLGHPSVRVAVASFSSAEHRDELLGAVAG
jgi:aryl-alcohol dehydrogenase-like predicted oxidoreductase